MRKDGWRRRRVYTPELSPLEPRALMVVDGATSVVNVVPRLIPNTPDGRQVPVEVTGFLVSNKPTPPQGVFFVTDEYGADAPKGHMPLVFVGAAAGRFDYAFDFVISLQAKRSTNTPDGRHYYVFVGGTDDDGTGGKTVAVLVPKNLAAATAALNAPHAATAPHAAAPAPKARPVRAHKLR
jgi:hypothetical protein